MYLKWFYKTHTFPVKSSRGSQTPLHHFGFKGWEKETGNYFVFSVRVRKTSHPLVSVCTGFLKFERFPVFERLYVVNLKLVCWYSRTRQRIRGPDSPENHNFNETVTLVDPLTIRPETDNRIYLLVLPSISFRKHPIKTRHSGTQGFHKVDELRHLLSKKEKTKSVRMERVCLPPFYS